MLLKPSDDETICAISTPPGNAGIGVIRISGKSCYDIGDRIFRSSGKDSLKAAPSHTLCYGKIIDPETNEVVDEAIGAVMRAPRSYTAEDVLEFSCHGNLLTLRSIIELLVREGAREALPGEFTKRAFLNGRIDLIQAEAVMDLISSDSERSRTQALKYLDGEFSRVISDLRTVAVSLLAKIEANIDFSGEDIEILSNAEAKREIRNLLQRIDSLLSTAKNGRIVREGFLVVLAGRPNAGKSSLLNQLLERERAIVTPIPGTTRDTIEEAILLEGVKIRLVDTAGIRETQNMIEREGIRRTEELLDRADLVLWVVDASIGMTEDDVRGIAKITPGKCLTVFNKIDLVSGRAGLFSPDPSDGKKLEISSLTRTGLKNLEREIVQEARLTESSDPESEVVIVRSRHELCLKQTKASLLQAEESLDAKASHEFVALDLKGAIDYLGEILGISVNEAVLDQIFKDFCIGK